MSEAPGLGGFVCQSRRGVSLDHKIGHIILGHGAEPPGEVRKIFRWVDASSAFEVPENVQSGTLLIVPGCIGPPFALGLDIVRQLCSPTWWQGEFDVGDGGHRANNLCGIDGETSRAM